MAWLLSNRLGLYYQQHRKDSPPLPPFTNPSFVLWLTDLHSSLANKKNTSAQLDDFDINPTIFPDAAFLPASVTLKKLDILVETFPPKATNPDAPMSRESWVDLFANGVKETEQGVVVHQEES
ncbi:hypothetical protein PG987_010041 [Apiospora arundinis]